MKHKHWCFRALTLISGNRIVKPFIFINNYSRSFTDINIHYYDY